MHSNMTNTTLHDNHTLTRELDYYSFLCPISTASEAGGRVQETPECTCLQVYIIVLWKFITDSFHIIRTSQSCRRSHSYSISTHSNKVGWGWIPQRPIPSMPIPENFIKGIDRIQSMCIYGMRHVTAPLYYTWEHQTNGYTPLSCEGNSGLIRHASSAPSTPHQKNAIPWKKTLWQVVSGTE